MVLAILAGTKTQTRRVVKKQPWASCCIEEGFEGEPAFVYSALGGDGPGHDVYEERTPCRCPYGQPGDRLYVRETWGRDQADNGGDRHWNRVVYRADPGAQALDNGTPVPWTPSIHMPRWASRITLEITGVRVERLQGISAADSMAEGAAGHPDGPWHAYRSLWTLINGAGSWDANPWVWVVEFRRA